ncbi:hypothetical protein ACFV6M_23970 [Streptomyces californicus]|uniref:hypothetical protein n=1 Tax=Streptomyces californicus TaxID=67351 RepID=UPI003410FF48
MRKGTTRAEVAAQEQRVLTDRAEITARAAMGESVTSIAKAYSIDRRTLARILDRWGAPRRQANVKGRVAALNPCKRQ